MNKQRVLDFFKFNNQLINIIQDPFSIQIWLHIIRMFEPPSTNSTIRYICFASYLLTFIAFGTIGRKTKDTSAQYFLRVTPPSIFFSIWGVIFLGLTGLSTYAVVQDIWKIDLWILIAVYNALISLWCVLFNSGHPKDLYLSFICQIALVVNMQMIWLGLCDSSISTLSFNDWKGILFRNLAAFTQGWLLAASALAIGLVLVHKLGVGYTTQLVVFWLSVPLIYGCCIYFNIKTTGRYLDFFGMFVSMAWAITGAMISSMKPLDQKYKGN